MKKMYTSIDIGTYSIKVVVAEYFNNKLYVLASSCVKSEGVKKGLIVNPELVIKSINEATKEVNDILGVKVKKVIVNVPIYAASFKIVTGSIDINGNNLITSDDVNRVIKDSVYNKLDDGYELVTVVPIEYYIDGVEEFGKPVGKSGQKLEIKGIMISTPKKNIYSVLNIIEKSGLEVADITVSGLSDYYEVRNDNIDKKYGAVINFGHEITSVSIFDAGTIVNSDVLQIGGLNVERDLSYVFGISNDDGRILKEKFVSSHKRFCQLNEIYEVKNNVGEIIKLNQLEASEVTMSRMVEILNLVKKQIRKMTDEDLEYIILTGGLTEISSFKNLVYEVFGKSVVVYNVTALGIRDNKYVTALGMIKYFIYKVESRGREYSMFSINDETILTTPSNNLKKDSNIMNKVLGSFRVGKEEK